MRSKLFCVLSVIALSAILPLSSAAEESAPAKLTALNRVEISSEIAARVTQVKVRDGDRFARGDLLASFDCTELRAELDNAIVQRKMAERQLASNNSLEKLGGSISELELLQSEAQLSDAVAKGKVLKHRAGHCEVRAPFNGFVIRRDIQSHQRIEIGAPLFELVDNSSLEIEAIIPSAWLSRLSAGAQFKVSINETGETYSATLLRIVPAVDPVTRTVKVIGTVIEKNVERQLGTTIDSGKIENGSIKNKSALISGMSGEAHFNLEPSATQDVLAGVREREH